MIMIGKRGRIPDGVESDAAGGAERLGVERRREDVGEAAEGPEAIALVVVHGRFVAQPPPRLIRSHLAARRGTGPSTGPVLVVSVMIIPDSPDSSPQYT